MRQGHTLAQETLPALVNSTCVTLQAAIFDCDGLLADTETPDFHAWSLIYAEHGLTLDLRDWAATIGIAKGHDIADRHTALAAAIGPSYSFDDTNSRRRALYHDALKRLAPMPGVVDLLSALRAKGVPVAVASNSERAWVLTVLQTIGVADYFPVVVTSDDVLNPKPAPDIYLLAAERLAVAPSLCAAYEDSPRGLAAADRAGMVTVAVPTPLTRHLDWLQAQHIVGSLTEISPDTLLPKSNPENAPD